MQCRQGRSVEATPSWLILMLFLTLTASWIIFNSFYLQQLQRQREQQILGIFGFENFADVAANSLDTTADGTLADFLANKLDTI